MNFPITPTLDQEYTLGAKTWKWNGTAWDVVPSTSAIATASVLGSVKGFQNLTIDAEGNLSLGAGNIKTINGQSLLGPGNVTVHGTYSFTNAATYNAQLYNDTHVDTTAQACTVSLPNTGIVNGDWVTFTDYAGTFGEFPLTINPNGLTLNGSTDSVTIQNAHAYILCIYLNNTWNLYFTYRYRIGLDSTPVLVGPTYINEYGTADIIIRNFNFRDGYYTVVAPIGTNYSRSGDHITWNFPNTLEVDTQYTLEVYFTSLAGVSPSAFHTITVLEVPTIADTMVNITNLATNSYNDGWTI